jgi:two-component system, OmpR family, heavy metal sensor histidine kinase CusS
MRSVSLTAKLSTTFAMILLLIFGVVAYVLYGALEQGIAAQDDLDIVLAARHFRRLASEFYTLRGVPEHEEWLDTLVLGNNAFMMEVQDRSGHILIEHNPDQLVLPLGVPVMPTARITEADIREWRGLHNEPLRGVSTAATLRDGTVINFVVARNMSDRSALLAQYRTTIYVTGISGMLVAFVLGYFLIRASLRPVREIARSAARITVERLATRIGVEHVPRELAPIIESFNAMLARLQRSFERLARFTDDLAHDLRTPISNMRGASEVALARPRSAEEYQALLASNLEECERVSRMIENVLFLARAEQPDFATVTAQFDVRAELVRIAEYFEGISDDAGVIVQVRAKGHLIADLELFRRAVSNLLANALRYTPVGGVIEISTQEDETRTRVTVSNPGVPIGREHLDKLFDRFYRVDPSRTNSSGSTGLGLAIVRSIMELHGGSASVESDATATRFHLNFPRR